MNLRLDSGDLLLEGWDLPDGDEIRPSDVGAIEAVADILAPPTDPYADDPAGWIRQFTFIWSGQAEIAESVRDNRYTAVRSAHGSGKSFIAAWIVCWWLATHPDGIVVTSAPSSNQVKNILWKEVGRAKEKAGMPGYITQGDVPEWKLNNEVVAFGRKPADYNDDDKAMTSFQGIHGDVLVILDEGSGIPEWLATAGENLMTNDASRLLMIGNPTNPASYFARMSGPNSGYHKIKISVWDTPAYTGEQVPPEVAKKMVGPVWVEERRKRWGEGSILWTGRVEAEFPMVAEDVLFTPAVLEIGKALDLSHRAIKGAGHGGWDVARMGEDETVLYINKRGYCRLKSRWGKLDVVASVDKYKALFPRAAAGNLGTAPTTAIDTTGGLGAGHHDILKRDGWPVTEFNFGAKAHNPHKFLNRRAEAYYEAMEAMRDGLVDIDELDEELQQELMEHRYKPNSTGRIQVEPKEDVAKRLGRSPDRADAFVMSLQEEADWAKALNVPSEEEARGVVIRDHIKTREPSAEDIVRDIMEVKL